MTSNYRVLGEVESAPSTKLQGDDWSAVDSFDTVGDW